VGKSGLFLELQREDQWRHDLLEATQVNFDLVLL
jgi:hypothetical protein